MSLITKPYETDVGFSSLSDEELFLINGGCMSGIKEFLSNLGELLGEIADAGRELIAIGAEQYKDPPETPPNPLPTC